MSISSPLLQNNIESKKFTNFEVDFFEDKSDLVYHFYPCPIDEPFVDGFHIKLEEAFKKVLPDNADVRAEYLEKYEIQNFERTLRPDDNPCGSFWVRVIDMGNNPMSSHFLKTKIFDILEEITR